MYTIPAFGPWPEQNAGPDEEKRLNSAQQSKTSPTSIDREHETGVFYGSGKLPYQTSLAACTCNDFVKRKKPCKHIYRLAMELGIIPLDYKTGRSSGERNEAQISFEDSIALVEQLSEAAQKHIENMLYYTSERVDDRQRAVICYDLDVSEELRTLPLIHENPYPLAERTNPAAAQPKPKSWSGSPKTCPCWQTSCRRVRPSPSWRCSTRPSGTFTSICAASMRWKQTGTPGLNIPPEQVSPTKTNLCFTSRKIV